MQAQEGSKALLRVRVFVTHPVQYHAPLWRALAGSAGIDLKVFYFNDQSMRGGLDKGFGVPVAWDVDLLAGYPSTFLSRDASLDRPHEMAIPEVDALMAAERPDWIVLGGYMHAFERQLVRAAPRHGARVLLRGELSDFSETQRALPKRLARELYLRWFYRHVDCFCYPGVMAHRHLRRRGVPDERLFFSPYAVDDVFLTRRASTLDRMQVRRSLGFADDDFLFMLSGKLIPRKDPMAVLAALAKLHSREKVGLVAIGDGHLRREFEAQARALLGPRFVFPGFVNQSELSRYYVAADALVMPSRCETWGLVVNEAMHHGLPVLVSDRVGCHPDLIIEGVTGHTYPIDRVDVLAGHMARLVDAPQQAAKMGAAAHDHVKGYTVSRAAKGVLEALSARTDRQSQRAVPKRERRNATGAAK